MIYKDTIDRAVPPVPVRCGRNRSAFLSRAILRNFWGNLAQFVSEEQP
jgi:hypothetical protein